MNSKMQTRAKASSIPKPSLTPVQTQLLQRKCACGGTPGVDGECVECRAKRLILQRHATSPAASSQAVPRIVHEILSTPGQPLDARTRAFMEPRFGHDFSQVRVHTDAKAAESARAVNALAYTVGRDVVFDVGQYRPGTNKGQKLLAHELTHVAQQQRIVPSQGKLSIGEHSNIFEREAGAATVLHSKQVNIYRPRQTTNARQISGSPMLMIQLSGVRDGSNSAKSGYELPRAKKIAGFDVIKSYCSCPGKIQEWIETSQLMIKLYADCGKDPKIKTGEEIEACQDKKLEEKGIKPDLAGSTSSTGKVEIEKRSGACGSIFDKSTNIHEGIHKNYERGLKKKYGEKTRAFASHWDNPKEWVTDETNAYNAEIRFYQAVAAELRSICGGPPEKRDAKK